MQLPFLVLFYCCESWKGLRGLKFKERKFESNYIRNIMHNRWFEPVSETKVREKCGEKSVTDKIRYHRWRWYGRVMRMSESRLRKQALGWRAEGSRRAERPKDTWQRTIATDKREKNIDVDVEDLAQHRGHWINFITALWAA